MSTQQAWAVGLFEGEGYMDNFNGYPRFAIEMTDKDVLERFAAIFPGGSMRSRQRAAHWKKSYIYKVGKKLLVQTYLSQMLPLLGDRRAHKALDILDHIECN